MGYKRVASFWCAVCGWKVREDRKMICDKCQTKEKTFKDCKGYDIN